MQEITYTALQKQHTKTSYRTNDDRQSARSLHNLTQHRSSRLLSNTGHHLPYYTISSHKRPKLKQCT